MRTTQPPVSTLGERDLETLRVHPSNLTFALYLELCYMDTFIKERNPDLTDRIHGDGKQVCDSMVIGWCQKFGVEHGRLPRVLDFGARCLFQSHLSGASWLAELIAADALGPEYRKMHEQHRFTVPVPSVLGIGEIADKQFEQSSFDLVHIRNALDHTQCPALAWLNLLSLVRVGGVLCHSHAIREATAEQRRQLHQFDLFPKGASLWIEDKTGRAFSLTDGLPVEVAWSSSEEAAAKPWFIGGYRKLSENLPTAEFLSNALWQMRDAFVHRSGWCFQLEGVLMDHLAAHSPKTRPVPITVSRDRV